MKPSSLNFAALPEDEFKESKRQGKWIELLTIFGAILFLMAALESSAVVRLAGMAVSVSVVTFVGYMLFLNRKNHVSIVLRKFAESNGFKLSEEPGYKSIGVVFDGQDNSLVTSHKIDGQLEGFNFSLYWRPYSLKSTGKHYASFLGVIEIELPKTMPHIFIDRKENNFLGLDLLGSFSRKDIIELEGQFRKKYRVFYVDNYQVATLTILNPHFMSVLLDIDEPVDFEFVENKLFIYYLEQTVDNEFIVPSTSTKVLTATAELVVREFSKQLDTFQFESDEKIPNEIRESMLKKSVRK